jgi:hypothetical protein
MIGSGWAGLSACGCAQVAIGDVALARQSRCSRIEWTADTGNPLALGFYAQLGTARHSGKAFYRMSL